jgi:hypothetical protein
MVKVIFPPQFSRIIGAELTLEAEGNTLPEILSNLSDQQPVLREHLFLKSGKISPFVAFLIGSEKRLINSSSAATMNINSNEIVELILPMAGG